MDCAGGTPKGHEAFPIHDYTRQIIMDADNENPPFNDVSQAGADPSSGPLSSEELAEDIDKPGKGGDIDEPGKGGDTVEPGKEGGDEFPDGREDFDNPGQSPSELPTQPAPELPNLPPD